MNLVLEEETEASSSAAPSARSGAAAAYLKLPTLGLILESVTKPFMRISGLDTIVTTSRLPAGEPRYGPAVTQGDVHFRLRGDGAVDSIVLHGVIDSTLAHDLTRALQAAVDSNTVPAYGDTSMHHTLRLSGRFWQDSAAANWPIATLDAPLERSVRPRNDNDSIPFPHELRRWNAELLLQFVVEPDGRVRRESIRNVRPATDYRWPTDELRDAYEGFLEQTIESVKHWRYVPAEALGCRVAQLVQQPFDFIVRQ